MTTYVFLGPSLPRAEAQQLLDAHYLPPVTMGDVFAVCQRNPSAIVIIDGLFERTPAVWHKEILYALARGIPVYGASSMGALRAAELDRHGMIGVGWIYEAVRAGRIEADDEVAVVHGPPETGHRCLSVAMVNMRHALELGAERGHISQATLAAALAVTARRYYATRSWPALRDDCEQLELEPGQRRALLDWLDGLADDWPDLKRDDARAVLERVARDRTSGFPTLPSIEFEQTWFWSRMIASDGSERARTLLGA